MMRPRERVIVPQKAASTDVVVGQPALVEQPVLLTEQVRGLLALQRCGGKTGEFRSVNGQERHPSTALRNLGISGFVDAITINGTPYAAPWLLQVPSPLPTGNGHACDSTTVTELAAVCSGSTSNKLLLIACMLSIDNVPLLVCVNVADGQEAASPQTREDRLRDLLFILPAITAVQLQLMPEPHLQASAFRSVTNCASSIVACWATSSLEQAVRRYRDETLQSQNALQCAAAPAPSSAPSSSAAPRVEPSQSLASRLLHDQPAAGSARPEAVMPAAGVAVAQPASSAAVALVQAGATDATQPSDGSGDIMLAASSAALAGSPRRGRTTTKTGPVPGAPGKPKAKAKAKAKPKAKAAVVKSRTTRSARGTRTVTATPSAAAAELTAALERTRQAEYKMVLRDEFCGELEGQLDLHREDLCLLRLELGRVKSDAKKEAVAISAVARKSEGALEKCQAQIVSLKQRVAELERAAVSESESSSSDSESTTTMSSSDRSSTPRDKHRGHGVKREKDKKNDKKSRKRISGKAGRPAKEKKEKKNKKAR